MQLLGQSVKHISFGKGVITDVSSQMVTVHFAQGEKRFLYPDAFSHFLTLKDSAKQKEVNIRYNKRLQAEETERKKECEEQERRRQLRTMKITSNAQAVFDIDVRDAEKIIASGKIATGCYLSGYEKGKPRIPSRLKPNSACLLTGLPENGEEKDRRILGAFMVNDDFWGEQCKNGWIEGHPKFKICLPADAALSYWDYFTHGDTFSRWGRTAFQYFSNNTMQEILHNMNRLLTGTGQESIAAEFYRYFCEINRLPVGEGTYI